METWQKRPIATFFFQKAILLTNASGKHESASSKMMLTMDLLNAKC